MLSAEKPFARLLAPHTVLHSPWSCGVCIVHDARCVCAGRGARTRCQQRGLAQKGPLSFEAPLHLCPRPRRCFATY